MKHLSCIFLLSMMCLAATAQTPYYFYGVNGEKVFLSLNTKHAFLSLKDQQIPADIKKRNVKFTELRSDGTDLKLYQGVQGTRRYYTELQFEENLSEEQYLQLLSDIKRNNRDVIIAPYFNDANNNLIGLSNFFYVELKEENDITLLNEMAEKTGSIIVKQNTSMTKWFVMHTTEKSELNALECAILFHESGLFESAEPSLMADIFTYCAYDQYFPAQWGLQNTGLSNGTAGVDISVCDAWQLSTGKNITVAVIDQGILLDHPDLAANMHPLSYDCYSKTTPQFLYESHGTECAGVLGALRNNIVNYPTAEGIAGVAPDCRIMSISHPLSTLVPTVADDLIAGIDWARINGADIISCSWGHASAVNSSYLNNAINNAVNYGRKNRGCIVVAASGNDTSSVVIYPACLANVIAVGAIDRSGNRADFSNHGIALDVVAPGVSIGTTDTYYSNNNWIAGYIADKGTSLACPHVSGIAALILSVNPLLTQSQVRYCIESTCKKITGTASNNYSYTHYSHHPSGTWNTYVGHGLVNAYAAVSAAGPPVTLTGPALICQGSSYTFSIANVPLGFVWNKSSNLSISGSGNSVSVTGSAPGKGWISVTYIVDGTLFAKQEVWVGPPELNIVGPNNPSLSSMNYYDAVLTNELSVPSSYSWSLDHTSNGSWISPQYNSAAVFFGKGVYQVLCTATNACGSGTGSKTVKAGSSFIAYPNPVSGNITIDFFGPNTYKVEVRNSSHVWMAESFSNGIPITFNTAGYPTGIYYLYVYAGSNPMPEIQQIIKI